MEGNDSYNNGPGNGSFDDGGVEGELVERVSAQYRCETSGNGVSSTYHDSRIRTFDMKNKKGSIGKC